MDNLQRLAEKRLRGVFGRTETPEWWALFQKLLLGGLGLFLLVALIKPSPHEQNSTATVTVPATTTPDATTTVAGPGPGEDLTEVPAAAGGTVEVPAAALAAASDATLALFTGNFSQVAFVDGTDAPTLVTTWPAEHVAISDPQVADQTDSRVAFTFLVDPDRTGPDQPRRIPVTVELEGARWALRGERP